MSAPRSLVVYHTSDIHARRGFGARLAAVVEPGALLVDCGDALAGSSVFYVRDERVADELRSAPYDAMAVGNREFHYLHPLFLARARRLAAPLVCSNLIDLRGRTPPFVRELTVARGGIVVRILGLIVPQYRTGSGWEALFGWRFLDPEKALDDLLAATPSEPAVTIVLSHLGLPADRRLARGRTRLSAILGGHTHDALAQPEVVDGVPIAHPGAYASCVGRLELALCDGATSLASYRLLPLLRGEG